MKAPVNELWTTGVVIIKSMLITYLHCEMKFSQLLGVSQRPQEGREHASYVRSFDTIHKHLYHEHAEAHILLVQEMTSCNYCSDCIGNKQRITVQERKPGQ